MNTHVSQLKSEDVKYVLVATNSGGPWVEDLNFLILAEDAVWKIPNANAKPVFEWLETFADVDWEQSIRASGCTEGRVYILWRREGVPNYNIETRNKLKERLNNFIANNFSMSSELQSSIVKNIFLAYEQQYRLYHGLRHIHHCLWELDSLKIKDLNKAQIELAIWYHDIIYQPVSKRNEIDSAVKLLTDFKNCRSLISPEKTAEMIRASAHAKTNKTIDKETQIFLDIE